MGYPWDLFVSPDSHQALTLDAGGARLVTVDGAQGWPIVHGVPDFVRREEPDAFDKRAREERWVERNWQRYQTFDPSHWLGRLGSEIAEGSPIILEIAAGPGGGNLPYLLHADAAATVLVNDLSLVVLEEWQQVLRASGVGPNVTFAAFDACSMPLRSGAIDVVASLGGLSNIPGVPPVLKEIHRVLRPGGRLFSSDLVIHREDWSRLPSAFRAKWEAILPATATGFASLFAEHGFTVARSDWTAQRELDPNEGDLPKEADGHGVRLRATFNVVVALKSER
jgi:SAM-dependent methyltransferase